MVVGVQASEDTKLKTLKTQSGIQFGLLGEKASSPSPTLVVIATDFKNSLESDDYNKAGQILGEQGWISIALDAPCHGADHRTGEPDGLNGWRSRLEQGDNFVAEFNKKVSEVLDYAVHERYTDPQKIAVAGTSRGGFMGLNLMAAEPRIQCAVAFAPVAELPMLTEFKGLENHPLTKSIALPSLAGKLTGRPIWICIGNNDQRVGTDSVIAFTRKVVAVSFAQKKPAPIEIHVMQTEGHAIHKTAHDEAAAWLAAKLK
jgi:dienelactone hydrolase